MAGKPSYLLCLLGSSKKHKYSRLLIFAHLHLFFPSCGKMGVSALEFVECHLYPLGPSGAVVKSQSLREENLIGTAGIRWFSWVQSSVAWGVGLCHMENSPRQTQGMWVEPE